jgi:hypothetical protein
VALGFLLVTGLIPSVRPTPAQPPPGNPVPGTAAAQTRVSRPSPVPDAKLTLRVYNYAQIDPVLLAHSEKVAAAIFENVGIEVVWVDCPLSPALFRAYPACQLDMGTTDLVLRLLPHYMATKLRTPDEPLGFAQPCPESEPACELSVFYYWVDELATNGYRADRILGHVIAHEVAHVLIGPGHSEEGIMRGEWSRYDLERISWGLLLGFTSDQSRQLRRAVLGRMKAQESAR